ncbi:glycosyltransferase [Nonlabens marinus]|uniref:Exopolysaccharide biosynthesis glycosyltransferase EpsF n=1 Tax=Nonlabens marinus S1-08 TaxID=1454201 RepID=W8VXD4_9FLAO|nr:glycosyltransferase [Nonlabens marinus]BAO55732.1 exopolysaccharide biosynthesis glycosyltransferase EpsF [Nonlabens marinus S1-08]
MINEKFNIAIFSPNQNPYSETFIQAHKNYLEGNIFYYYGTGINTQLENSARVFDKKSNWFYKSYSIIANKPKHYHQAVILSRSLRQHKIDIALIQYGTHAAHLLPVFERCGIPFVVHFHGYDASIRTIVKGNNSYQSVFKNAASVLVVSKKMEEMVMDMGCSADKLVLNHYGAQPLFNQIQCKFSKPQFIAIGRFVDKKAPYYTILAFSKIVDLFPEARLIIAGNGVLYNTCRNLVKHLELEDKVKLAGVITPEKFQEYLQESMAFVQHSVTALNGDMEGTPLAVIEASTAGLPVISTYHAGIPDVILHGKTGLLCEEHDVNEMAANMVKVLADREYAMQLGKAGKKHMASNYSFERHINNLKQVLHKATNKTVS